MLFDFEWNEKSATEGKKDIGLIAEEVAEKEDRRRGVNRAREVRPSEGRRTRQQGPTCRRLS